MGLCANEIFRSLNKPMGLFPSKNGISEELKTKPDLEKN
jgi:hypothetical protein